MKRSVLWVTSVAATMGLIEACGGSAPVGTEPKSAMFERGDEPTGSSCAASGAIAWKRVSLERQSGAVVLARSGNRTIALAADEDSQAIHAVDVDTQQAIGSTFVGASPAQLMMLADGRVAVTLRDKSELAIYEPASDPAKPLRHRCSVKTPAEPIGMALTNDDASILVVGGWSSRLTEFAAADLKQGFQVEVPRDPRAVVVDESGTRAFVSHVVGSELSVIDLGGKHEVRGVDMRVRGQAPNRGSAEGKLRTGAQGFALVKAVVETPSTGPTSGEKPVLKGQAPKPVAPKAKILVPMVTVSPGDPEQRSQAYYGESVDGLAKEAPIVHVIDANAERSLTKAKVGLSSTPADECLLPRAAAFRSATSTLLVACAGINQVVELDTAGTDPSRLVTRRIAVPSGPMGIALDEQHRRAVVWSQFDASVSVIDLSSEVPETIRVAVDYRPTPQAFASAAGRELFHTTDDSRISNDGVACASCHPDGRDDSLTWSTPEGPRQTIMLAGRTPGTAPYGWVGKHGDLKTYIKNTFSRLGGRGLPARDLDALSGYLDVMPGPATAGWSEQADAKLVAHGRDLFMNEKQGCASCHTDAAGTDKAKHDVGSRAKADLDGKFDTPSLVSIRGTAPYFHDGRYKTLDEMLAATDSEMGHTAHLSQHDRSALKAFLGGL